MMPLALFRSPTFSGANLLTFFLYGAFGGALFWLPFNLIQVQGYTATEAGAALLPAILIIFALSRWTGALIGRYGARLPLTIGPSIVALAFLLFALPGTEGSYWTTFFPAAVVLGIGMAITVPPLTTAVMSAVPQQQAGTASGINNAVARTAGLIAIAVFGVIVTTVFNRELTSRLDAMLDSLPGDAAGGRCATTRSGGRPPTGGNHSSSTAAAIDEAIDASFVAGFRVAMAHRRGDGAPRCGRGVAAGRRKECEARPQGRAGQPLSQISARSTLSPLGGTMRLSSLGAPCRGGNAHG